MDMGSIPGTILGTIMNYKKDSYVHCQRSLSKANIDRSSLGIIPQDTHIRTSQSSSLKPSIPKPY